MGGIDCTPRQFTGISGMSKAQMSEHDAEEIREMTTIDKVHTNGNPRFYESSKPEGWIVDFEGVVKGFL